MNRVSVCEQLVCVNRVSVCEQLVCVNRVSVCEQQMPLFTRANSYLQLILVWPGHTVHVYHRHR